MKRCKINTKDDTIYKATFLGLLLLLLGLAVGGNIYVSEPYDDRVKEHVTKASDAPNAVIMEEELNKALEGLSHYKHDRDYTRIRNELESNIDVAKRIQKDAVITSSGYQESLNNLQNSIKSMNCKSLIKSELGLLGLAILYILIGVMATISIVLTEDSIVSASDINRVICYIITPVFGFVMGFAGYELADVAGNRLILHYLSLVLVTTFPLFFLTALERVECELKCIKNTIWFMLKTRKADLLAYDKNNRIYIYEPFDFERYDDDVPNDNPYHSGNRVRWDLYHVDGDKVYKDNGERTVGTMLSAKSTDEFKVKSVITDLKRCVMSRHIVMEERIQEVINEINKEGLVVNSDVKAKIKSRLVSNTLINS